MSIEVLIRGAFQGAGDGIAQGAAKACLSGDANFGSSGGTLASGKDRRACQSASVQRNVVGCGDRLQRILRNRIRRGLPITYLGSTRVDVAGKSAAIGS